MSVQTYAELRAHVGHDIECVAYGLRSEWPLNVAVECETCGVVLLDFDRPDQALDVDVGPDSEEDI